LKREASLGRKENGEQSKHDDRGGGAFRGEGGGVAKTVFCPEGGHFFE